MRTLILIVCTCVIAGLCAIADLLLKTIWKICSDLNDGWKDDDIDF